MNREKQKRLFAEWTEDYAARQREDARLAEFRA